MIRSVLVVLLLGGGVFAMSQWFVGYPHAGMRYIAGQKEERRSIRPGSHYYYGSHYGTRGFRGGK
jgi:hypothetical protein